MDNPNTPNTGIIVALDFNHVSEARQLIEILGNYALWYKVGPALFAAEGLNLNLSGAPNTVADSVTAGIRQAFP